MVGLVGKTNLKRKNSHFLTILWPFEVFSLENLG